MVDSDMFARSSTKPHLTAGTLAFLVSAR